MRQLLFSVTAADCNWSYTRGTGKGGQARNKTNSAVHCIHRPSGAHGYAEEAREQRKNRETAFKRMAETKEFKTWHEAETRRLTGQQAEIDARVERQMRQIRVDIKNDDGLWQEVDKNATLDMGE